MGQRNPNPNATSDLTNWSKVGSSTTLTSTSEGARWVGGSSGTGRALWIKVPMSSSWGPALMYLGSLQIRRNSGTAQITRFQGDGTRWTDWGGGTVTVDGAYGEVAPSPAAVFLPVGTFIRPFRGYIGNASGMVGDAWADAPNNTLGHSTKDGFFDIHIVAENNKPFDFTIKGVGLFDGSLSGAAADPVIDTSDATFTVATTANNVLAVRATWNKQPNEPVETLEWNWGDGTAKTIGAAISATYQAPTHTYAAPGIYTVTLTAKNSLNQSASTSHQVTVPTGTFEAHYAYETDWLNIAVDASSSVAPSVSPIDTYAWNWGDGQTTAANASKLAQHTYASPGTYNVTLTVNDNATNRTDTEVKAVVVTAPPNPDNYFVASKDLLTVAFVPSIQDGSSYAWAFGDGASSTDKEPVHTYEQPGTYSVTLTVNGTLTTTQDVTVNDVYTPLGQLLDALRLEVAIPYPSGTAYNRIRNTSGELGAWGWITPVTNSYLTGSTTSHETADKGIPGAKLIYRSSGASTQYLTSTAVKVAAGQYAAAQLQSPYVDGYYRARVDALNAAGALLGSSALTGYQQASQTATVRTTPYLLPAGTASARVVLYFYANTSDAVPAVNKLLQFRRVMLATAATSAELTALPFSEYADWQDLIGPTSQITVERAALDVGRLTATILDSTFDPATNGTIRPGQAVRLRVKTPDDAGNVRWQSIFTGQVDNADVEYVAVKGSTPGPKSTRIKLAASDAVTLLSRVKEARGVAKIKELPEILERANTPYEINGSTGQVPAASIVNANDNASVLDQVAITRDSDGGYAFVDRDNVLQVREPEYMPTAPVGVIDETAYSDIKAGFNTDDAINSVSIRWLRYSAAAGTEPASVEEVTYGPYEDAASIEEWGLRTATFTMLGVENPTAIGNRAAEILTANAQPARMITDVQVPIRNLEDLTEAKALIDLYSLVRLGYARTETDELIRVTRVKHRITPKKWLVNLGFSADGAVASPQLVASPPVAAGAAELTGASTGMTWRANWGQYDASGNRLEYKREGRVHTLAGAIRYTGSAADSSVVTQTVLTITNTSYVPPGVNVSVYCGTGNGGQLMRVIVLANGTVAIQKVPGTAWAFPASDFFAFSATWIA